MKFPFKAFVFGPLILTTTGQGQNAPFMDSCTTNAATGERFKGKCFLLKPWKRNKYGESLPQRGLVIGWKQ